MGGDEAWEGAQATRIDVAFVGTVAGSLETPGGTAEMIGRRPRDRDVLCGGRWEIRRGRRRPRRVEAVVTLASAPGPIPVKSTTTTTVSVIK